MLYKLKKNKAAVYLILIILLCFCLCQYGLQRIFGFSLFPDEFGYWAPAAKMLGWDWSETTSLGSYYSFGYSLILAPILYFVKDSIMAYRTAVVVNMILMCIGLVLLYKLMQKLFPEMEKESAVIISWIAVLYPPWIFYIQMTMTEALLLFLYILVCYLFLCFFENPRVVTAVMLSAALVYIYFVHMRSIGMIVAGGIILLFWGVGNREKKCRRIAVLVLLLVLIFFLIGLGIKNGLLDRLYHTASVEVIQYNDYSGQWGKLKYLMSPDGMKNFITGSIGKILYIGLATYGLAYWGIYYVLKRCRSLFFAIKSKVLNREDLFWLFLLLSSVAQFIITVIYTIWSSDEENDRLDLFVHGRYIEFIIPVLIAIGIKQAFDSKRLWTGTGIMMGCTAVFTWIVNNIIGSSISGMPNVHGYFMIGMSYLIKEENFRPIPFLWKAWLLGSFLMAMIGLVITACKKWRIEWLLTAVILLQIILGLHASEHYVYIGNSYGYGDIQIADKLKEVLEADGKERIIHIYEGDTPYIEQVQFRMQDRKIDIWDAREKDINPAKLQEGDKLILAADSKYREIFDKLYERSWEAGHLCLYYNP